MLSAQICCIQGLSQEHSPLTLTSAANGYTEILGYWPKETVYYLKEKENFCEVKTQYLLFLFRYLSCVHTGSNVGTRNHKKRMIFCNWT